MTEKQRINFGSGSENFKARILSLRFSFKSQSCEIFENDVVILVCVTRSRVTETKNNQLLLKQVSLHKTRKNGSKSEGRNESAEMIFVTLL